jgi:hypothetical protein
MRANEFLINEARLSKTTATSWAPYLKALTRVDSVELGDAGELAQGLQLTNNSKEIISNLLDEYESLDDKNAMSAIIKDTKIEFTDGTIAPISKIFKSSAIKSVSNTLDTAAKTYWNAGSVAETFLGAALFTRFQSNDNITADDVMAQLRRFEKFDGGFKFIGHRNNDPIDVILLNNLENNKVVLEYINNYSEFAKTYIKGVKGLNSTISACVSYVNNAPKIKKAIEQADSNTESDRIIIKTDGVSDQKGTKADLQLKIGNIESLLSLKVNAVKQFGQASGVTPSVISAFFNSFIPGIDLSSLAQNWPAPPKKGTDPAIIVQTYQTIYSLIGQAYTAAFKKLNANLTSAESSAMVVNNVHDGILHHVQGATTGQTVVILNPKAGKDWQELDFNNDLIEAMQSFRLEASLTVASIDGSDNHILKIYGRPIDSVAKVAMTTDIESPSATKKAVLAIKKAGPTKVDPELLIQLRSYLQNAGTYIRNIVEMGPLLKDIADVEKINKLELPADPVTEPNTQELDRIKKLAGVDKAAVPAGKNTTTLKNKTFSSPKSAVQSDNFDAVQSAGTET